MSRASFVLALYMLLLVPLTADADRERVLAQIDVPHDYYFREMYLPQLTSGPSSLCWMPDGRSLVYSMQGSLWRQSLDSELAVQLSNGPGYDYQPDCSPDGKRVVYTRYDKDALELRVLNMESGKSRALTSGGAVNLEPRFSPDGSQLAFVSTRDTGRFRIYIGSLGSGEFVAEPLSAERKSKTPRYYYSEYDHELSPSWSPDGQSLIYISNPETVWGTGSIWQRGLDDDDKPVLVRKEETNWKARPDWAPDGKRIAYSSYLGRQRHQLWLTTIDGGAEPFPISYGEFDITAVRWSPDGKRIAFISNENGDTGIRIQDVPGGATRSVLANERQTLEPMGTLSLQILDSDGKPLPARVAIVAADGRSYIPTNRWAHADDGFDRKRSGFEVQYYHSDGEDIVSLPPGPAKISIWRGLETQPEQRMVNISNGRENALQVQLKAIEMPATWRNWISGDVHVHMNYGGAYVTTPERLIAQAAAEDLDVVFNLVVNKEQRIPDIGYFSTAPDAASDASTLLLHAQEFHTSFWGHLGLLGLQQNLLLPDYSAYAGTAAASLYPDNVDTAKLARDQGAAVGYVHPFLSPAPDPESEEKLSNALPVDAALGLVDYYEVVGFADHRASAEVWYRLLNCGLRIAAAGGTDAMANYASLRGPVGINRTYVQVSGKGTSAQARRDSWLDGLKAGRSIASNGPVLGLEFGKQGPGSEIKVDTEGQALEYRGFMRSIVPMDHLELVQNGEVIKTIPLSGDRRSADFSGTLNAERNGWVLLRAWNDSSSPLVFDIYPYATTSPVYLNVNDRRARSKDDADYFLAWLTRIREAVNEHEDFNNDAEKNAILEHISSAEQVYKACR